MTNTSATGGYLSPGGPPTPADTGLEDILQRMVVGITSLPGEFVRPRWQNTQPKHPEPDVDWCAIGVATTKLDAAPAIVHDGDGEGSDHYSRHQDLNVRATFYGPNAQAYAQILADGLSVPQNGEALKADGMVFVSAGDVTPAPDLLNQQWVRRYDLPIRLRRKIKRTYAVLNVLSAETEITPS